MTCQQVTFTQGTCVVEIREDRDRDAPSFAARLAWVDDVREAVRPLVFADGERVIVKGPTEPAALRAAVTYLEQRFGALCEPEHGCSHGVLTDGPPLVVEPVKGQRAEGTGQR